MGGIGCFMVCFVLAVEHVGFKFTMLVGIAIEIPFALGEAVLGVEAVLVRNWRDLQVILAPSRRQELNVSLCLSVPSVKSCLGLSILILSVSYLQSVLSTFSLSQTFS